MRYLDVRWFHHFTEEPQRIVSEIGDDDFETRKLEFFADGTVGFAHNGDRSKTTRLGTVEIPSLGEINTSKEFQAKEITKDEFEQLWLQNLENV